MKIRDTRVGADVALDESENDRYGHRLPLIFSTDGKSAAMVDLVDAIKIWDLQTGKRRCTIALGMFTIDPYHKTVYSPDSKFIAAVGTEDLGTSSPRYKLKIWDAESGRATSSIPLTGWAVDSLKYSPDAKRIALITHTFDEGTILSILDAETGRHFHPETTWPPEAHLRRGL